MTAFDEDVLSAAMHRVKALETLEDSDKCRRLTLEGYLDLLIRAGYSEDDAQDAANQRGWSRLEQGTML